MNYHILIDSQQALIDEKDLLQKLATQIEILQRDTQESDDSAAEETPRILYHIYKGVELPAWPEESRVLLYLSDEQITSMLVRASERKWQISILPHPDAPIAVKAYGVAHKLDDALFDGLQPTVRAIDLLLCDERPVLFSVVVGDVFGLRPGGMIEGYFNRWKYLFQSIKRIGQLVPQRFELQTHNAEKIVTAAIGITIVEHGDNSVLGRRLFPDSSASDGKFHGILLSPRSVMELIRVLVLSLFSRGKGDLPECVGLIETSSLTIECRNGFQYRHDNVEICTRNLSIRCEQKALTMVPGRHMFEEKIRRHAKERRRIQYLPSGVAINELTTTPLRWIAHAATEDFKELYQTLRENAVPSSVFLTLMILSTMLASVGLFANSPPVIIGAMILAPLMAPIVSLAMAIARQDESLLRASVKTLMIGLILSLFFAVCTAFIMPIDRVTHEIAVRIQPNILDLAVAVISGIAAAYAHARAAVAKSLAGVAIAVALVPPLAVIGIGLGWADLPIIVGAFLLFFTNLAGIVLAAAGTFLVLGFAPFNLAKRGLMISLIIVGLVSVPLGVSFSTMIDNNQMVKKLEGNRVSNILISKVTYQNTLPITLSIDVVASRQLDTHDFELIKDHVESTLEQPIVLEIHTVMRLE